MLYIFSLRCSNKDSCGIIVVHGSSLLENNLKIKKTKKKKKKHVAEHAKGTHEELKKKTNKKLNYES